MLVLTRKLGESVAIGDRIRVIVLEVRGSQVRLGIEAPPDVPVHREEIYRQILEQNRAAARAPLKDLEKVLLQWQRSAPLSPEVTREGSHQPFRRR